MSFVFSTKAIKGGSIAVLYDENALSGVKKIASKVASDIGAVFGAEPKVSSLSSLSKEEMEKITSPILVGTVGISSEKGKSKKKAQTILETLETENLFTSSDLAGKREVYRHKVIDEIPAGVLFPKKTTALVIFGSDKRGTIYGLFALSEKLGVSPFVDWLDVKPSKMTSFSIPGKYIYTSKEPSVRFRGFFINDEWPAFGNWCNKRFGGFNAQCYEHVFELLLRLKIN